MLKKRAQGLSIRFIIMAVMALIVLVVLIAIFSGKLGNFASTVVDSQSCSQLCQIRDYSSGSANPGEGQILPGGRDSDGNQCYCSS